MSKSKRPNPHHRKQISIQECCAAINAIMQKMEARLEEKGYGSFTSIHEVLGMLTEEYQEIIDAVHLNDWDELDKELLDLAVGAIFSLACLRSGGLEW